MFVTGYCSFLAQSRPGLPQSCGFNWGVLTHTQRGVDGAGQLWADSLGIRMVVTRCKWRNRGIWGDVAGAILDHSCIKLSHASRFRAVLFAISVWALWGRGSKSEVSKLKQFCQCHWLKHKLLSWTFPPSSWLVISIISEEKIKKTKLFVTISLDR